MNHGMLSAPFAESLSISPTWTTMYDVNAWRRHGYRRKLIDYQHPSRLKCRSDVTKAQRALITSRIKTLGEHPCGLGTFTRTLFSDDLRRQVHVVSQAV